MLENMLSILAILFCLVDKASTTFEDCMKQNGKEIVLDVCVPDRYNKMVPPNESPVNVQIDLKINGLKVIYFLIIHFPSKTVILMSYSMDLEAISKFVYYSFFGIFLHSTYQIVLIQKNKQTINDWFR